MFEDIGGPIAGSDGRRVLNLDNDGRLEPPQRLLSPLQAREFCAFDVDLDQVDAIDRMPIEPRVKRRGFDVLQWRRTGGGAVETAEAIMVISRTALPARNVYGYAITGDIGQAGAGDGDLFQLVAFGVCLELVRNCIDGLECDDMARAANALSRYQGNFSDICADINEGHSGLQEILQERNDLQVVIPQPEHPSLHVLGQAQVHSKILVEIGYRNCHVDVAQAVPKQLLGDAIAAAEGEQIAGASQRQHCFGFQAVHLVIGLVFEEANVCVIATK